MDDGYAHIGSLLRNAREEQRLSLEHIARQMHIRLRYLQALEDGRINDLPGVAYAKGYLQAYAAYLQLDKMEILRRFEQMEGMLSRKGFFFPQVFSKEKKASGGAVSGGLIAAVIAYGIWAYALKPDEKHISVIDTPVSKEEKARISAAKMQEVPCLKPLVGLYPPCYKMTLQQLDLLPLSRQHSTIMELADLK